MSTELADLAFHWSEQWRLKKEKKKGQTTCPFSFPEAVCRHSEVCVISLWLPSGLLLPADFKAALSEWNALNIWISKPGCCLLLTWHESSSHIPQHRGEKCNGSTIFCNKQRTPVWKMTQALHELKWFWYNNVAHLKLESREKKHTTPLVWNIWIVQEMSRFALWIIRILSGGPLPWKATGNLQQASLSLSKSSRRGSDGRPPPSFVIPGWVWASGLFKEPSPLWKKPPIESLISTYNSLDLTVEFLSICKLVYIQTNEPTTTENLLTYPWVHNKVVWISHHFP